MGAHVAFDLFKRLLQLLLKVVAVKSVSQQVVQIILGKQRNGPIGSNRLAFIGQFTKFENLAPMAYQDYE